MTLRRAARVVSGLTLAGFICVLAAAPARAHGIVQRTEPAANSAVATAPRQVVLYFSEPADAGLSSATVTDREGTRVATTSALAPDGRRMTITLPAIPNGVYTIRWRALWPADGHSTSGFFLFSVGESAPSGPSGAGETAAPIQVAFRWIAFLAALVVTGTALLRVAVLRPALRATDASVAGSLKAPAESRLRTLTIISAAAVGIASAAEFVLQATQLLGTSVVQAISSGLLLPLLWNTRAGWSLLLRLCAVVLLLLPASPAGRILQIGGIVWLAVVGGITVLFSGPGAVIGSTHVVLIVMAASVYGMAAILAARVVSEIPDFRERVPHAPWVPPLAGAILLAAFTMTAHAAGEGLIAAAVDWLHLLGAAAWIGGLVALLTVLVRNAAPAPHLFAGSVVSRFSAVAGGGLAVLTATGLVSTLRFVPSVLGFVSTPYGRLLLAKLALVVPLAALGAFNFFILRPRVVGREGTVPRLIASVTGEAGLGALIVLIVAALTITPTARVALQAPPPEPPPLSLAGVAGDMRLTLDVAPARPGSNRFVVRATDQSGAALEGGGARVLLRATKLDEDLDPATVRLEYDEAAEIFAAEDGVLGLPGWWQLEVAVRRRGRLDVTTQFPLYFEGGPDRPLDAPAVRLLQQIEPVMGAVRSWTQVEQLTDGKGNVVVTRYEVERPDRLRYHTSTGNDGVLIGADRYFREPGGEWVRDVLTPPFAVERYVGAYSRGAQRVARGRTLPCGTETCVVLLWETPSRTATLAGWVGERSGLLRRVMMVGFIEAHHMTLELVDFNQALRIRPPQ